MVEVLITPEARAPDPLSAELELVALLRAGNEAAFGALFDRHHAALVRLAGQYVAGSSVAEEVAQETWIAFVESLERFEGRSSVKTWLFRTLVNCARNRRRQEVRSVPFSAVFDAEQSPEATVDPSRFASEGVWAGHWAVAPRSFGEDGERKLLRGELRTQLTAALDALPPAQREVVSLRDIEGFSSEEVCEVLGVTEVNQRVLLHRARARIRTHLETYLQQEEAGA